MTQAFECDILLTPGIFPGVSPLTGRFAPSPTGRMHAGNIFASLVCWLLCKRSGGGVVLRIEDLDRSRSKPEYASQIMRDYELLGLTWDHGPYYQGERDDVYAECFSKIAESELVYPCYCTRADLHAASAPHQGEKAVYPGTCRKLSSESLGEKAKAAFKAGRKPSYRVAVPDRTYRVRDIFQGEYIQNLESDCGDFVIKRSDGAFAYQLAVVVDDAEQGVDFIARGSDLLSSTPQQLYLQDILVLPHPQYAHVPLMMGDDGHRLSKRHEDADLERLLHLFGTPEAILGHIAWISGLIGEDAPCSADELLRCADLRALVGKKEITWASDSV